MVDDSILTRCQELISYRFDNLGLLSQALTHASAAAIRTHSNERMEFLGDAVLGLVICHEIYTFEPDLPEGEMTKVKSSVVSRRTCDDVARRLGLVDLMMLGKGVSSSAAVPPSLGAAVLEAVIGAIYLDGGLPAARAFILEQMADALDAAMVSEHQRNFKSLLQQHAQQHFSTMPVYDLLDEKGPEHAKCFEVAVRLNGRQFPSRWGNSKKHAEQKAALSALIELGVLGASHDREEACPPEPAGQDD